MERTEEQSGRVQLVFADKTQPVEWTSELILPDYRSEISRLLWVRPTLLPPTRFVGGGKAELCGVVRYCVLYVGPDGMLYSAEHEEEYSFSVPMEIPAAYGQGIELTVDAVPDAVISRVIGPRKLSVRCRLHARVCGYAERGLAPVIRGLADGEKEQRLCDTAECGRLCVTQPEHFSLGERIEIDEGEGEVRVIAAHGSILLNEASAALGEIRCQGEVQLELLVCREAGEDALPYSLQRRIPFEKELPAPDISPEWQARALGEVGEIHTSVEDGAISVEIQGVLWGEGQAGDSVILCRDLYMPGKSSECHRDEIPVWRPALCENRHFTVSAEGTCADCAMPADCVILCALADAEIGEWQANDSGTVVNGRAHCHALYSNGSEIGVASFYVPFRTVLDAHCDRLHAACTAPVCRATRTGDRVRWDVEVGLCVRGCADASENAVTQATLTPAQPAERADLEICYPAGDETLWAVGKRYGVAPDALAAANGLSADAPGAADSLANVRYLLIP